MATELDALQLNFTANTSGANQSIEKLISKLGSLREAIGLVNSGSFVANAENMVESMNAIKTVADQTNSANLKDIASGIRSLASATKSLTNGSAIRDFFENLGQGVAALSENTVDFGNVNSLLTNVAKLGSGNVVKAGESLEKIAVGLRQFQGLDGILPKFEGMESFTYFLRGLGSKSVVAASGAIGQLATGLRQFVGLNINVNGLTELAQSLSMFGRKTAQSAITTIPQLATAFRGLITTLASAPQVSSNVISLANALANFMANLRNVNGTSVQASRGLHLFGNTASRVSRKTFSLASAIGKLYATYFLLFRAFGKVKEAINISSELKEVENVVNTTFGSMTDRVNDFARTSIENFGLSELSAKQYASRFQAMGVAMGIPTQSIMKAQQQLNKINPTLAKRGYSNVAESMADISLNLTKLTADMASFYNVAQEDVAKDLESVFTGSTRPLRQYGLDVSLVTIQEWALKNGIDANVKSMSQAEKTMLRYQYIMANTSALMADYQKTSMTWSNQVRKLGQNFERLGAAIGNGLIAWLRPAVVAINSYMDSIIAAVQRVVNALGQIFGWQMIVDTTGASLVDDTLELADAYDDATGAAKKLKQQLLGIDELNNLTTKDNGSGSGGAGLLGGLGGGNIIEPGGISFVPFESDIKDLETLGKRISEALRNLLPDDWSEIYEKARGFGTGFSDFLNGLIQPDTFYKLGQSVAGILNTISEAIIAFLTGANWAQYKDSFVAFWDGLTDEIHISTVGLIVGAISIKKVGKWIIGGGALKTLQTAFAKVGASSGISSLFAGIGASGAVAAGAVAVLATGLGITYAKNEDVRESFAESVNTITNSLAPALQFISKTLLPDIKNGFNGILEIVSPLGDYLSTVFTSIWQDMINPALKDLGENVIPKLTETLRNLWENVLVPVGNLIKSVLSPIIEYWSGILNYLWKNAIVPVANAIGNLLLAEFNALVAAVNVVIDIFGGLIKIIDTLWKASLGPLVDALVDSVKPIFDDVFTFIGNIVESTMGAFTGLINFITGVFTGDWEKAWNGVKDIFANIFNGIVSILEFALNAVIDGINLFLNGINWATSGISEISGKDLKIKTIQKLELPRFANGGFPDQGSLFLAGETYGQSEWLGNVNGRTGVVSGNEITGIADAIYQTSSQEMELLRQQNQYLIGILNKEFGISTNQIGKAAREYAQDYSIRNHGRQAYQF